MKRDLLKEKEAKRDLGEREYGSRQGEIVYDRKAYRVSPNMKLYDYFYDYDNGLGMIFYEVSDRSVYEARKGWVLTHSFTDIWLCEWVVHQTGHLEKNFEI